MTSETASWSLEDINVPNVHDALSEFEDANRTEIERARANGTPRTFLLENKLEQIMKEVFKVSYLIL